MLPTHLRSRGEHPIPGRAAVAPDDPPPLARRAPEPCRPVRSRRRPTSARAESTLRPGALSWDAATHLRSRGEHASPVMAFIVNGDPPPLARRALRYRLRPNRNTRPTSARAESTAPRDGPGGLRPTHLRSRGEHPIPGRAAVAPDDPPPLARRALPDVLDSVLHTRPTSARAESTFTDGTRWVTTATHLRSRGEHTDSDRSAVIRNDPPPLARRAHDGPVHRAPGARPTSARAESTSSPHRRRGAWATHLRSRGEHDRETIP